MRRNTIILITLTALLAVLVSSCSMFGSKDDPYYRYRDTTPDPTRSLLSGVRMEEDNGFTYQFDVVETRYGYFTVRYKAHKDCSTCPEQESGTFSFAYDKCEATDIAALNTDQMMLQGGSATAFRIFKDSYTMFR